jgi:hypothetical protein
MPTTSITVTTATALIAATGALALGAAGPATAAAAAAKKCGNVTTRNGGKALYINAQKLSCRSARTIARRANGKTYKSSGFTCRSLVGLYSCTKPGTSKNVAFSYRKPS